MAAPKGNKYYLMQSKHGRDKDFKTPEELWDAFLEYLQWSENNPLQVNDVVRSGKDAGKQISIIKERPLSIERLANYVGLTDVGLRNYGKLESHKAFFNIFTRVKNHCDIQKVERAEVGDYNANIVARVLGLRENLDHSNKDGTLRDITVKIIKDGNS